MYEGFAFHEITLALVYFTTRLYNTWALLCAFTADDVVGQDNERHRGHWAQQSWSLKVYRSA